MFENTCVVEMPNDTPNVQDTSCYELSNGGKIHDVRKILRIISHSRTTKIDPHSDSL